MNDEDLIASTLAPSPLDACEPWTGHAGATSRIHLVRSAGRPLVAKVCDRRDDLDRFDRERAVLAELGPRLGGIAPRLVAAGSDDLGRTHVLVTERVDGRPGDSLTGLSNEEIRTLVRAMAPTWTLDERDPRVAGLELPRWGRGTPDHRPHHRRADRFRRRLVVMSERFPTETREQLALLTRIAAGFETIAGDDSIDPCVVHGDLHGDNVVFDAPGPRVLDWQTTSLGDPVHDIARLGLESRDPTTFDELARWCEIGGLGDVDSRRIARAVLLVHAGFVTGMAGRPGLTAEDRDHRIAARILARRDGALLVDEALATLGH